MEKFICLTKTNEKGVTQEPERWNIKYIVTYRKWMPRKGEKDLNKTIVVIEHPTVPRGNIVVDNSVDDIDNQIEK